MNNNTNDQRNEYNAKKRAYHEQKRREALEQAKKKNVLGRSLECEISEEVYEEIRKVIAGE